MTIPHDREQLLQSARSWFDQDPNLETRIELAEIIVRVEHNTDPRALGNLAERFNGRLEFGTARLRGALGAGPTRMNRVVVGQTAAGLAAYLGWIVAGGNHDHMWRP